MKIGIKKFAEEIARYIYELSYNIAIKPLFFVVIFQVIFFLIGVCLLCFNIKNFISWPIVIVNAIMIPINIMKIKADK